MGKPKRKVVATKSKRVRAPLCGHLCKAVKRGNCPACYAAMHRLIMSGEITMKELVKQGLMAESRRGHWPDAKRNPCGLRARKILLEQPAK